MKRISFALLIALLTACSAPDTKAQSELKILSQTLQKFAVSAYRPYFPTFQRVCRKSGGFEKVSVLMDGAAWPAQVYCKTGKPMFVPIPRSL